MGSATEMPELVRKTSNGDPLAADLRRSSTSSDLHGHGGGLWGEDGTTKKHEKTRNGQPSYNLREIPLAFFRVFSCFSWLPSGIRCGHGRIDGRPAESRLMAARTACPVLASHGEDGPNRRQGS